MASPPGGPRATAAIRGAAPGSTSSRSSSPHSPAELTRRLARRRGRRRPSVWRSVGHRRHVLAPVAGDVARRRPASAIAREGGRVAGRRRAARWRCSAPAHRPRRAPVASGRGRPGPAASRHPRGCRSRARPPPAAVRAARRGPRRPTGRCSPRRPRRPAPAASACGDSWTRSGRPGGRRAARTGRPTIRPAGVGRLDLEVADHVLVGDPVVGRRQHHLGVPAHGHHGEPGRLELLAERRRRSRRAAVIREPVGSSSADMEVVRSTTTSTSSSGSRDASGSVSVARPRAGWRPARRPCPGGGPPTTAPGQRRRAVIERASGAGPARPRPGAPARRPRAPPRRTACRRPWCVAARLLRARARSWIRLLTSSAPVRAAGQGEDPAGAGGGVGELAARAPRAPAAPATARRCRRPGPCARLRTGVASGSV